MLNDRALQALFLTKAEAKHAASVPAYSKLKALVEAKGGVWAGDHIALRTMDERVAALLQLIGIEMNLHRVPGEEPYPYRFPDKRLKSFDLLGKHHRDLKLFVSVWDETTMQNPAAIAAIKEDIALTYQAAQPFYDELMRLAEKAKSQGGLEQADANLFTDLIVDKLMSRIAPPLKASTYALVAQESGELASAMVLGEGINHFTVDVRVSGFESTEAMRLAAAEAGMKVLPKTSGREGWLLQSATLADEEPITLLAEDGSEVHTHAPLRFMEFIWRPEMRDEQGNPMLDEQGKPVLYSRFEQTNAANIFEAASVKKQ